MNSLSIWLNNSISELNASLQSEEARSILDSFNSELTLKSKALAEAPRSNTYYYYQVAYEWLRSIITLSPRFSNQINIGPKHHTKSTDIVFWPWQLIHWDYIQPIFEKARKKGINTQIISNNPTLFGRIKKLKEVDITFRKRRRKSFLRNSASLEVLNHSKRIRAFVLEDGSELRLYHILLEAFKNHFNLYLDSVNSYKQINDACNPKALFIGNTSTLVGASIWNHASRDGKRVFSIMHGALNRDVDYSRLDRFYVFGQRDREFLKQLNFNLSKVIVSGSPKLDLLVPNRSDFKPPHKKFVLVAFSGPGHSVSYENHEKMIALLANLVSKFPNENFVVKLHKKDKKAFYKSLTRFKNIEILDTAEQGEKGDIYSWLMESKALITGASTSALDAMILKVPVLSFNVQGTLDYFPMIKEKVIFSSDDSEQLALNFRNLLVSNDFQRKYVSNGLKFVQGFYANLNKDSHNASDLILKDIHQALRIQAD